MPTRAKVEAVRNRKTFGTNAVVKQKHDTIKNAGTHANRAKKMAGPLHYDISKKV
jgi:hypothetical protein